jgi:hypothetical protein
MYAQSFGVYCIAKRGLGGHEVGLNLAKAEMSAKFFKLGWTFRLA